MSLNGLCGGGGDAFEDDLTPVARSVIESSGKLPHPPTEYDTNKDAELVNLSQSLPLFSSVTPPTWKMQPTTKAQPTKMAYAAASIQSALL